MFVSRGRTLLALAAAGAMLLTGPAGTAQAAAAGPGEAGLVSTSAGAPVAAAGEFTALVDFTSIRLSDAPGGKCVLTVNGTLVFSGTLQGDAVGTTTAMVSAPCSEVASTPPGTYFDVFRFEGAFTGTVDGANASGDLTYSGVTHEGGAIDALVTLRGDAEAMLRADAIVAQGGTYTGVARL